MSPLHGKSIIAGRPSSLNGETFNITSPIDLAVLPGDFLPATLDEVDAALVAARESFPTFRASSGEIRAAFLETIANNLVTRTAAIIHRAHLETGLPPARLHSEMNRTTGHLRMFAEIARKDSWRDLRIESADPHRQPTAKPELRRMFQPIGPVVVFGASNFPLAYSVAGGDTASALATGNPVVVKAHEAHPGTSELVAGAILSALSTTGLPAGIFSLLHGHGKDLGVPLTTHSDTRAIAFTGSTPAGRILMDAAAQRPDPIPVFAEMGSLNPIVILPSALEKQAEHLADRLVPSITNDAGQFCTKPGVIILPASGPSDHFFKLLADRLHRLHPVPMLHRGIHQTFHQGIAKLSKHPSVTLIAGKNAEPGTLHGSPHFFQTDAESFLADDFLRQEFFGPLAIFVTITSDRQIQTILRVLGGQITASIFCQEDDPLTPEILPLLSEIAGRVVFNAVPTGVEVNSAIQHGGPWPACSDSRFSAVGPDALLRFVRPVSYQNFPQQLLPQPLR